MAVATLHSHGVTVLTRTTHRLLPGWVAAVVYVALLAVLAAGVWLIARAAKRMTRSGRIIVAVIGLWTVVAASVAFRDGYRPTGDWGGGLFEAASMVAYALVAAAIVLGVDKSVRRFRSAAPV